jgi:hypothetical protein
MILVGVLHFHIFWFKTFKILDITSLLWKKISWGQVAEIDVRQGPAFATKEATSG